MLLPRPPETFLGRDDEIDWLDRSFPLRRVLVLKGMEGIGKTALALALLHRLGSDRVLYVDCLEGWTIPDVLDEVRGTLGLEGPGPEAGGATARAHLMELLRLVNERDLVLALDDVHRLPRESLGQLIRYLQSYLTGRALLVTSEELPGSDLDRVDLLELRVEGLGPEAGARLLQSLLTLHRVEPPPDAQLQEISAQAGGHPLLLKLAASALLRGAGPLPGSGGDLGGFLLSRLLDGVTDEERGYLEAISLAGAPLPPAALPASAARDESLGRLERRFLVVRDAAGRLAVPSMVAGHLVRGLAPERRVALHRLLAEHFSAAGPVALAFQHRLEAGDTAAAALVLAREGAAMCSQGRYRALADGADRLQAAGEVLPVSLVLLKARALANLGRWEDSRAVLEPVVASGDLEALVAWAGFHLDTGRWVECLDLYRAALERLGEAGEQARKCHHYLALIHAFRGEIGAGQEHLERARALPGAEAPSARAYSLRIEAALRVFGGDLERGVQVARASAERAQALGNVRLAGLAGYLEGFGLLGLGRLEEADRRLEEVLRDGSRLGDAHLLSWGLLALGAIRAGQGLPVEAREVLSDSARAFRAQGNLHGEAMARGRRALLLPPEERSKARREAEEALAEASRCGNPWFATEMAVALGRWDLDAGDAESAARRAAEAAGWARDLEVPGLAEEVRALAERAGKGAPTPAPRGQALAPATAAPAAPTPTAEGALRVECLGGFRLEGRGRTAREGDWPTRKAMRLCAMLCARGDGAFPDTLLMDALWPDSDPTRARNSLRNAVHQVRAVLRDLVGAADPLQRSRRSGLLSLDAPRRVDVEEFEAAARQGADALAAGRAGEAVEPLRRALDLYRGDFLEGLEDEWILGPQEHYRDLFLKSHVWLGRALLEEGRAEEAESIARTALRRDDLLEEPHALLLEALVAQNRKADGMRHYRDAVERFEKDLGCRPRSLEDLYPRLVI